jgi:hypothetical protein
MDTYQFEEIRKLLIMQINQQAELIKVLSEEEDEEEKNNEDLEIVTPKRRIDSE